MNKDGYYQSSGSTPFSMSRSKYQTFRVVLITSLFWVLVDAFLIFYMTDCNASTYSMNSLSCERKLESVQLQLLKLQKEHAKLVKSLPENHDQDQKDYEDHLKERNRRLHDVHAIKKDNEEKESNQVHEETSSSSSSAKMRILDKIKEWFKEDHSAEPTNPPFWPGENGRGVVIPENLKKESEKRFKENQFNIVASDLMALNRSVPDQRSES